MLRLLPYLLLGILLRKTWLGRRKTVLLIAVSRLLGIFRLGDLRLLRKLGLLGPRLRHLRGLRISWLHLRLV